MDQSNEAVTPDFQLRVAAIQLAIQANNHPEGWPPECISVARDFYLFISNRDPVLDVIGNVEEDNVILLDAHRK